MSNKDQKDFSITRRQHYLEEDQRQQISAPKRSPTFFVVILVILITNFSTFLTTSRLYGRILPSSTPTIKQESNKPSLYSDIDQGRHAFNFSAFSIKPSKYTAQASAEVDAEWEELGVNYGFFVVPEQNAAEFNIDDNHVILPADAPGNTFGAGYVAIMEALHQLHCVNLVRKALYFNYEYYSSTAHRNHHGDASNPATPFTDKPHVVRGHVNHCIDMLRERITCSADTGVVPFYWLDADGKTVPDFAQERQCRNFESVRDWVGNHQVIITDENYRLETPENAKLADEFSS